ncbi:hypothetical protein E2C01_080971 [Portunus trituberculatus]|uniref:Uncharacterized protein n=1 Tax=Portunus trituberculatus TaxID=210409 RepID=A0A5B7IUK9_PORTR|nr:hypothetical protein [Portunus trituberculatus]
MVRVSGWVAVAEETRLGEARRGEARRGKARRGGDRRGMRKLNGV